MIYIHGNSWCISFELASDDPINELISHPMCSSEIKTTAGVERDAFTVRNVDSIEPHKGGEWTSERHGPPGLVEASVDETKHQKREIYGFTLEEKGEE